MFQILIVALMLLLGMLGFGLAIYGVWREEMLRKGENPAPGGLLYIVLGSGLIALAGLVLTAAAKNLG